MSGVSWGRPGLRSFWSVDWCLLVLCYLCAIGVKILHCVLWAAGIGAGLGHQTHHCFFGYFGLLTYSPELCGLRLRPLWSGRISKSKTGPYLKYTLIQEHLANMLLEQCVLKYCIWSKFDKEHYSRLFMVQDGKLQTKSQRPVFSKVD